MIKSQKITSFKHILLADKKIMQILNVYKVSQGHFQDLNKLNFKKWIQIFHLCNQIEHIS